MTLHGICLAGLGVLSWVLVVVSLATDESNYSVAGGGCGMFSCNGKLGDDPRDDACNDRVAHVKAAEAFGVMSAIIIGATMVVHVVDAALPMSSPFAAFEPTLRFIHLVSALFTLLTWCLLAAIYSAELCSYRMSDSLGASVSYGVFFFVSAMCIELASFVICSQKEVPNSPEPL